MKRLFAFHCFVTIIGFASMVGCGETKPSGMVQGKATLSGKPIPAGKVVFRSPEGMGDDREAFIVNGEFLLDNLPVGPQRVEVTGVKGVTVKTLGNGQILEVKSGNQPLELKLGS